MIDEARREEYRGMQVGAIHGSVTHTLLNGPWPWLARVVGRFEAGEMKDGNGKLVFEGAKQTMSRVWVNLN